MLVPNELPKPQEDTATAEIKTSAQYISNLRSSRLGFKYGFGLVFRIFGVLLLCVTSSALTVFVLSVMNVINLDAGKSIIENRDKLVLQEGEVVAEVFKKASPMTVSITTESAGSNQITSGIVQEGAGSGIILSADGYLLTNKHVVPVGVEKATVIMSDGQHYDNVPVIGRDPFNDIAFLKIANVKDLTAVKLGDSDQAQVGQKVIAIGNALGVFKNSVTSGIISGIGRPIEATGATDGSSETLENLIQTDAAINPGNSGGPLLNLQGELIGINTAVAESSQGIGFAIPINDAKAAIKSILEKGKIIKAYIGVRYVSIDENIATQLKLSVKNGAYVGTATGINSSILPDSPADKAGIKPGDIILKVNDGQVDDKNSLARLLAKYAIGDKIQLTILRADKDIKLDIVLAEYPGSF